MQGLLSRHGARITLAALLLSIAFGVMVPIYADELAWRFQLSRLVQDGWVDRIANESCGNLAITPPFFMWPVRLVDSLSTALTTHPLEIRLIGMATALAMIAVLIAIVRAVRPADGTRRAVATLAYALIGIGLLPLLMVWSRPEQPVALAMLLTVLVTLRGIEPGRSAGARWLGVGLVFALAVIAISLHAKVFFFFPLFAAAMLLLVPPGAHRLARAVLIAALALIWAASFHYWSLRFACPDDPVMAARFGTQNLASMIVSGKIAADGENGVLAILGKIMPFEYFHAAMPGPRLMSSWLPALMLWPPIAIAWKVLLSLCWIAAAILAIGSLRDRVVRARPAAVTLALAIVLGIAACSVTQLQKNAYEAALMLPLLVAALVLILGSDPRRIRGLGRVALWVAVISVAGQAALAARLAPRLALSQAAAGTIPAQNLSTPIFSYGAIGSQVRQAARLCRIPLDGSAKSVSVDEFSYLAFARSWRPMYRFGMVGDWAYSVGDSRAFLRARQSSGIIGQCRHFKPELRAGAVQVGEICCLGAQ